MSSPPTQGRAERTAQALYEAKAFDEEYAASETWETADAPTKTRYRLMAQVALTAAYPQQTEGKAPHVDRVAHDGFGQNERLIERLPPDSPKIGAQEKSRWATYVYVSTPHTMAECPWSQQTEGEPRAEPRSELRRKAHTIGICPICSREMP